MEQAYSRHELKQGAVYVAKEPTLIRTLLGSCVSVCLFSPRDRIGAMSHSVLPYPRGMTDKKDVRYVECAIMNMLEGLDRLGVPQGRLEAKLLGGAEMYYRGAEAARLARAVGSNNALTAQKFLRWLGVRVVFENLGGNSGRRVVFDSSTGLVVVHSFMNGLPSGQAWGRTA